MLPSKDQVYQNVPKFNNTWTPIVKRQVTGDIITGILQTHREHSDDYDEIIDYFYNSDVLLFSANIFDFLKQNTKYIAEDDTFQTVRTPGAILNSKIGVDCKHYSLFIAGLIDACNRKFNTDYNWYYRFAAYDGTDVPGHVFVIITGDGDDEIWIDPVLSTFNERKRPNYFIDRNPYSSIGRIHHVKHTETVGNRWLLIGSVVLLFLFIKK